MYMYHVVHDVETAIILLLNGHLENLFKARVMHDKLHFLFSLISRNKVKILTFSVWVIYKSSKEESKDEELIQSNTTPDPSLIMGK